MLQVYTQFGNIKRKNKELSHKMGNILDKHSVLDRIKQFYGLKGNAELARFLGVAPNTITNWYGRSSFDIDIIYTKCVDIDLNWLFSGHGSMSLSKKEPLQHLVVESTGEASAYYKMYKEKDEENKELLKENAVLKERLHLIDHGNSDFQDSAEVPVSTGSNLLQNTPAISASVPLKK